MIAPCETESGPCRTKLPGTSSTIGRPRRVHRTMAKRTGRTSSLSSWFFICGACLRVQESPAKTAEILDKPEGAAG